MSTFADSCGRTDREEGLAWYAVRVRSNYERVAAIHLRDRGYDEFCPSYKSESKWSDRTKTVERFLFPGYVFSRFHGERRLPVLSVPGVVGVVSFGTGPCPIPDQEIENVRSMVDSGLVVSPWPYLGAGQLVRVERGPLAGVEGTVQEVKGNLRLVVSITMLQRAVSAELDRAWVRPVQDSEARTRLTHGEWVQITS